MGTAWEEKAGCDWWRQSNVHKEIVLRWTALGLPAECITRIVWSFLQVMHEHACASCYMLKLLKPSHLKTEPNFTHFFLSWKYKNEWQRSQSSCVICIFSRTKVSAVHSCCWGAPKKCIKDGHNLQHCYSKSSKVGKWCGLSWASGKGFW